jgi:PST family polysaccharide transporter
MSLDVETDREDLRGRAVRGTVASGVAQASTLIVRTGSIVVLSRLLTPADFGLVAMATTATGFLSLFRDFGLSTASIQRRDLTHSQASTLFWINLVAGLSLAGICAAMAPLLVKFYGDGRLLSLTLVLSLGFVLSGASAQHRALLQRRMQFGSLAAIDVFALSSAVMLSVILGVYGFGYWAIVSMTVFPHVGSIVGLWGAARWLPGRPVFSTDMLPLLRYGGTLTLNGLVMYLAYNFDKLLLGRVWGAEALGLYSRAYQLMTLSTDSLNSAVSQVAFPALARVQHDSELRRRYFIHGYRLFLTVAIPLAFVVALFAEDIISVLLGQQWLESAAILRVLTGTMLVIVMTSPLAWLLLSAGQTGRSLAMAAVIAPVTIVGCLLGVSRGPMGVAAGFSTAMLCLLVPLLFMGTRGVGVGVHDMRRVILPIVAAAAAGAALAAGASYLAMDLSLFARLAVEALTLFGVTWLLLFVFGERAVYIRVLGDLGLARLLRPRHSAVGVNE